MLILHVVATRADVDQLVREYGAEIVHAEDCDLSPDCTVYIIAGDANALACVAEVGATRHEAHPDLVAV